MLAFLTGLTIDLFYDTAGIHAAACTLIGFSRHFLLKLLSPRDGYEAGQVPTYVSMGPIWFLSYSAAMIFLHHLFFFYLEIFRFSEFFTTLLRVILSTIGTFALIYIIQFLFHSEKKK